MSFKYRKLTDLHPLENNPRYITDEDMDTLVNSIQSNPEYFEARPLILSDRTGKLVILAGNQRFQAAKILKLEKVPTFLLSNLTEEKEREIIIRDNVNNGKWDYDTLANEWSTPELIEWGLEIPKEYQFDAQSADQDPFDDPGIIAKNQFGVIVMCDGEDSQKKVFEELTQRGLKCKIVVV